MTDIQTLLKQLGFSEKAAALYRALLGAGPMPVRKLATLSGVNRGTAYDVLKDFMAQGLVSFYHQKKKQYFVAEDPEKLLGAIETRVKDLEGARREVTAALPELRSLHATGGTKAVVRYYEGPIGVRHILEDVLAAKRPYLIYSSANIRDVLYASMPDFTARRVKAGLAVKVIAVGSGGEAAELSERRWLTKDAHGAPTYTLIYGDNVAFISVGPGGEPRGVIMEDAATAETQKTIFMSLWNFLK